jgi:hypothetical protein
MSRPPWQRLKPETQLLIAKQAAKVGLHRAAAFYNVSATAARRACAITGIAPMRYERALSKQARIASALSLLRSLHLTPQDLIAAT